MHSYVLNKSTNPHGVIVQAFQNITLLTIACSYINPPCTRNYIHLSKQQPEGTTSISPEFTVIFEGDPELLTQHVTDVTPLCRAV